MQRQGLVWYSCVPTTILASGTWSTMTGSTSTRQGRLSMEGHGLSVSSIRQRRRHCASRKRRDTMQSLRWRQSKYHLPVAVYTCSEVVSCHVTSAATPVVPSNAIASYRLSTEVVRVARLRWVVLHGVGRCRRMWVTETVAHWYAASCGMDCYSSSSQVAHFPST